MNKYFKNLLSWIKNEGRQLKRLIVDFGSDVVLAGQHFKAFIEQPGWDWAVSLTNTTVDDKILAALRAALETLFPEVKTLKVDQRMSKIGQIIAKLPKPLQDAVFSKAGALTVQALAKKKGIALTHSEADTIIQLAFKTFKMKPVVTDETPAASE